MKQCIRIINSWLDSHSKVKEWLWFITLWCGGLITCTVLAYPIKFIIKKMS